DAMVAQNIPRDVAEERLVNLLSSPDGNMETLLATLNARGTSHRAETVHDIRRQLNYCRLDNAILTGSPVVGTRLDELGDRRRAMPLFCLTLVVCFGLLYLNVGCSKVSAAVMAATVFSIQLTLTVMLLTGQEMNFVMSSLPVMVMVFTTSAAIHCIGHYRHHIGQPDAVGKAIRGVLPPGLFAAVTTVIGLVSLAASDFGPIPMFGIGGAIGTTISFLVGIFVTPAILLVMNYKPGEDHSANKLLCDWAMYVVNRPARILVPGTILTLLCAVGLGNLRSLIDPLEFLPANDKVTIDAVAVSRELTSTTAVEAVVDFGNSESSFVDRLRRVRDLEHVIAGHPNVRHTLSVSDFFPDELSEQSLSLSRLASASGSRTGTASMLADGSRLWRISIRLFNDSPTSVRQTVTDLTSVCASHPVHFTGLGPLLEYAQGQIFTGFWSSFAWAFVLITAVMMIALRSVSTGLIAMIPNLTPIVLVFGMLGWLDQPVDIGIMMTASIALGLAVDGTFHFLFSYRECRNDTGCRYRAVRCALLRTGGPIISSSVVCGIGLLALALSPFRPTMRFGLLMFLLMTAALAGDLLLLPAFLALGARRRERRVVRDDSVVTAKHRTAA
ncbi:MAG: MMPL family transporter, partial [Planctomycetaceae bacterium]|nr:MMPL family transporter [Planctomycetaceae bacterium]